MAYISPFSRGAKKLKFKKRTRWSETRPSRPATNREIELINGTGTGTHTPTRTWNRNKYKEQEQDMPRIETVKQVGKGSTKSYHTTRKINNNRPSVL